MKTVKNQVAVAVLFFVAFFSIPAILSAQNNPEKENVRADIEKTYQTFAQYIKDGNAAGIVQEFYTDDAKFYPPNGGVATGKEEIRNVLEGIIQSDILVELEIKELEVFGNMAYEYGVAKIMSAANGTEVDRNEYVVLWKKDQGDWKIYRDFIKGSTMHQ